MKFPTLMGEIISVKADQKHSRQCYAGSLKVVPYPPNRESGNPHPTSHGSENQVMSMDEESTIQTLTVYKAIMGDQDYLFDVDPHDDIVDKGPKPIKELVKL
ncbi:hypothetical protein AAZX31_02G152100 [Glycine max]